MSEPININNNIHVIDTSPLSTISENESDFLPANLASEELKLALNKEATEEELIKAISRCKSLILECDQCSEERKWIVRHLIELRLRLQECRDAMEDPLHPRNYSSGVSKRFIKGHHFNLQPLLRHTSTYCDHCTGKIWSVVQAWYQCEDCDYSCHHKCLASVIRECAHVIASEKGRYEYEICPELGLSAQKYLCAECKSPLPVTAPCGLSYLARLLFPDRDWSEARRCDYSGLYYCTACHWGSLAIIPARVIHNWDLDPQPVSQAALQLLKITARRPIININQLNPSLFVHVLKLNLVRRLRNDLFAMKKYLMACRKANEEKTLWKHLDTPYMLDNLDMYSLQDLVDTHSGELPFKLQTLVDIFVKHIKIDCEICKGRGHICEICSNDEVLFPFDNSCQSCSKCFSVFHKHCFKRKPHCLKCARLKKREEEQSNVI
ncbi:differentially expressed in FDCP 8 homolog isoform X1 [Diorhabda carinulata]|uniref:differentially expressed in FDCP 8 homolog isoform X1 n=1 Tax=Diorhabda carinulata TaxID=1163345 RepID=UPI0025A2A9AC|nr:differentially expressed in FDCP 8 homolog isoform X1 [Diorhabda carinulata]